ncbi:MAG: YceI family protein [Terracidiphilus sp.]
MKRLAVAVCIVALTAPAALAQTSTWKSEPERSVVSFTVRHLGVTDVRGSFGNVDATIVYDAGDAGKSSVVATVGVNTESTGESSRDDEIESADFFDSGHFPTATFISSSVSKNGHGLWIRGNLTLHGITRPVVLDAQGPTAPVEGPDNKPHSAFFATATIDRTQFGIGSNYPAAIVGDEVQLQIDLKIVKE